MGHCFSVASSVHYADHGHQENVVYHAKNNESDDGAPKFGSIYSHQGSKGLNQDAAVLYERYGVEDGAFCGVFDGHGKNGHIVSKMVRNRLPSLLLNQRNALGKITTSDSNSPKHAEKKDGETTPNKNSIKWKEACMSAFKLMDKEIKSLERLDCSCSGAAAVVAIRQGDDLIIANLGDSRAVLGTKTKDGIRAVQLTTDLKPSLPSEAERIRKCNGRVFSTREEPDVDRVWLPDDHSPGLAMSRALGDFILKHHGVIATPEISYHRICPDDKFLVLATDGDVLSNKEVLAIVESTKSEAAAANAVVNWSLAAWRRRLPTSRRDDCTVICLFFAEGAASNFTPKQLKLCACKSPVEPSLACTEMMTTCVNCKHIFQRPCIV